MLRIGRSWWVAAAVLATVLASAAGCAVTARGPGQPPPESSGPVASSSWREPPDYWYTVDSRCGERLLIGKVRLTVSNARVVAVEGLDEPGRGLENAPITSLPTLRQLLDEYDLARRNGADVARAEFDAADGHPTRIDLDPIANAIDDEACYVIEAYGTLPVPT